MSYVKSTQQVAPTEPMPVDLLSAKDTFDTIPVNAVLLIRFHSVIMSPYCRPSCSQSPVSPVIKDSFGRLTVLALTWFESAKRQISGRGVLILS